MTFSSVLLQKTVSEWRKLVDIDRYLQRSYVVVDPLDPEGLLYLTHREYERLVQTAMSSSTEVTIVARPGMERALRDFQSDESNSTSPHNFTNSNGDSHSPPKGATESKPVGPTPEPDSKYETVFQRLQRLLKARITRSTIAFNDRNITEIIRHWGRILAFWAGSKIGNISVLRNLDLIGLHLAMVVKNHGPLYTIKYMKASLFCIYNYVGRGPQITDTRPLGATVRLVNNLPKWLPLDVRMGIRKGNLKYIRTYTSLLNSFKGLEAPYPDPSYATIQGEPVLDTFEGLEPSAYRFWAWHLKGKMLAFQEEIKEGVFRTAGIRVSTSAGPNGSPAWATLPKDMFAWLQRGSSIPLELIALLELSKLSASLKRVWRELRKESNIRYYFPEISPSLFHRGVIRLSTLRGYLGTQPKFWLGKLALKFEPAGKVRVFALVDTITQSICKPIHLWMFRVLRQMESDSTFDQEATLNSLSALWPLKVFSYDLTAATDNIPLNLYKRLFSPIFGERLTELWLSLLVQRDFKVPTNTSPIGGLESVRYTRGQPMGALSSWASLALVHHFLMWIAAERTSTKVSELFSNYRVLGDDIVITLPHLAQAYAQLCAEVGIPLNVKKSLISDDGLTNFANRVIWNDVDISPVSLREELAVDRYSSRLEMALRLLRRGWSPRGEVLQIKDLKRSAFDILRLVHTPDQFRGLMHVVQTKGYLPLSLRRVLYSMLSPDWSSFLDQPVQSFPYLYTLARISTRVGSVLAELGREVHSPLMSGSAYHILNSLYVVVHLHKALRSDVLRAMRPVPGWIPSMSFLNPWDSEAQFPLQKLGQTIVADERSRRAIVEDEAKRYIDILQSKINSTMKYTAGTIANEYSHTLRLSEYHLDSHTQANFRRFIYILVYEMSAMALFLEEPPVFETRNPLKTGLEVLEDRKEKRDKILVRTFLKLAPMPDVESLLRWWDKAFFELDTSMMDIEGTSYYREFAVKRDRPEMDTVDDEESLQ